MKSLLNILFSKTNENTNPAEIFYALNDISFEVHEGERIGIIGHNGAGKTTLLNLLGGFISHDTGTISVNGTVNAVLNIGSAVREELTGVENIYLNGQLHNKTKEEIDQMVNEIIDFADLGVYINKPVKTYSSGMKARLSFSMLSFIDPEILIIDEVLGVGDKDFAVKSSKKMQELCAKGKVLIVVSHSMGTIREITDRTIWLEGGKIKMDGPSAEVTQLFSEQMNRKREIQMNKKMEDKIKSKQNNPFMELTSWGLELEQVEGYKFTFNTRDRIKFSVEFKAKQKFDDLNIKIGFYKKDGTLLSQNSFADDQDFTLKCDADKKVKITCAIGEILFSEGIYECNIVINNAGSIIVQDATLIKIENPTEFYVTQPDYFCTYSINSIN